MHDSNLAPRPSIVDAENAVLGSILIDGNLINAASALLNPGDFYKTDNKDIYSAMLEMYKNSIPIDILTLFEYLQSNNKAEKVGGSSYLTYLTEIVPTTANTEYYSKLVKESSKQRTISQLTEQITNDLKQNKINSEQATEKLNKFISDISIESSENEIVQLSKKKTIRPREYILEGLIPKDYPTTLFGGGGVGKSYLGVFFGINACIGGRTFLNKQFYKEPLNTLYLDYELDEDDITHRAIKISNGLGLEEIPDNFFYKSPEVNISQLIHKLPNYIKAYDIKFIVIDSMGASGLDSMDEKAVIYIYSKLPKLGVTSLLLDHQSKQQPQEYEKTKTPYGSAYKSFLSRSVIHIVQKGKNDNCSTVQLLHKKTNFGKECDNEFIDFIFDEENNSVFIVESTSKFNKDNQIQLVQDYIQKAYDEGKELIQSDLIEKLKDSIKKDKLRELLEQGKGKYWNIIEGKINNSKIYVPLNADLES